LLALLYRLVECDRKKVLCTQNISNTTHRLRSHKSRGVPDTLWAHVPAHKLMQNSYVRCSSSVNH